jgi:hypothetical protein
MIRILVGLLVFASCGGLQAAPLVYFTLEGRPQGSNDAFSSSVAVEPGDTVEYRLRSSFAPEGATNSHVPYTYPYAFSAGKHGLNSLSISIVQDAIEPIQVDLSSPIELTGPSSPTANDSWGWSWAPNHSWTASPGAPTLRPGSNSNDLVGIRPLHAPGVFTAQDDEVIFTGVFNVALVSGESGIIAAKWGPDAGGGWFHGYSFYPTPAREQSSDPLVHFTPLTLVAPNFEAVPEPSTLALLGTALIGLAIRRCKSRRNSFHSSGADGGIL